MQPTKSRLGKGLDSLLADSQGDVTGIQGQQVVDLSLNLVKANPEQPRKEFSPEALSELADSIREKGVIQPIIVQDMGDGTYQIVAGERRFRATQSIGLPTIPAIVRNYTIEEKMEIALIENIQRENLNAVEEAMAYRGLMDRFNLSQDEMAKKLGKNRSTVANSLRLLKLPKTILDAISAGTLSAGHARAVLSVDESRQEELFQAIQGGALSVREAEALARTLNGNIAPAVGDQKEKGNKKPGQESDGRDRRNVELIEMEEKLIMALGTKVQIKGDVETGRIEIQYFSMTDLERLHDLLVKA